MPDIVEEIIQLRRDLRVARTILEAIENSPVPATREALAEARDRAFEAILGPAVEPPPFEAVASRLWGMGRPLVADDDTIAVGARALCRQVRAGLVPCRLVEDCSCWTNAETVVRGLAAAGFVPPGPRLRHVKRGSTYAVVGRAELQASAPVKEGDVLVVYVAEKDGRAWARPVAEFEDGRFIPVEEVTS